MTDLDQFRDSRARERLRQSTDLLPWQVHACMLERTATGTPHEAGRPRPYEKAPSCKHRSAPCERNSALPASTGTPHAAHHNQSPAQGVAGPLPCLASSPHVSSLRSGERVGCRSGHFPVIPSERHANARRLAGMRHVPGLSRVPSPSRHLQPAICRNEHGNTHGTSSSHSTGAHSGCAVGLHTPGKRRSQLHAAPGGQCHPDVKQHSAAISQHY